MKASFGSTRRERPTTSRNISQALQGILIWICTAPGKIIRWLTSSSGGQISLSLLMIYFMLVNIESYWQSIGQETFIPKPFIADQANFSNILGLLLLPNFWLVVVFVLALNAVSAVFFRDVSIDAARKRYNRVAAEKLPSKPNVADSLTIALVRHRQLKSVGMKRLKMAGFGVVLCLTIDLLGNYSGFPWIGASNSTVLFLWWIASTFGFEVCGALLEAKEERAGTTKED
jgi:hypothetical protein